MMPPTILLFAVLAATSPQDGMLPPWESKPALLNAQQQIRTVSDALTALDAEHWKGDYQPLFVSTRQRMEAVADAVKRLADKPESLSLAMEAFLSMEQVEDNMASLTRGAERFQPNVVKDMEHATDSFQQVRENFQTYLLDLSRYLEKNLTISTKNLESCREQLDRRPASGASPKKKN